MERRYTPIRIFLASIGALVIGTDTYLNMTNQVARTGSVWDPIVIATFAVALATAVGSFAVLEAFRSKLTSEKILGMVMLAALVIGFSFTFSQSIERTASQYRGHLTRIADAQQTDSRAVSARRQQVLLIEAEIASRNLEAIVSEECHTTRITYDPRLHNAVSFPNCDPAFRSLRDLTRQKAAYIQLAIEESKVKLWEVDWMAETLARGLPFTQETLSVYSPWLLPLALLLFGFAFFAFGMAGHRSPPEFDLSLSGDAATVDRAERYVQAYRTANGCWPTRSKIAEVTGLSPHRADRIRARIKARKTP